MVKRGYRTVTLPVARKKHIRLFTGDTVANAAKDVLEQLESGKRALYYVTKLGQVIEAVLERGRVEGRAEVIEQQEAIKKRLAYRLPGRPKSN